MKYKKLRKILENLSLATGKLYNIHAVNACAYGDAFWPYLMLPGVY